jgi:two-component system, NtrC family, nitrogen regulation response regulator NtrX
MSSGRILVVDDEADIRATISDILTDEGYTVRQAEDATAARIAVQKERPDLILLDVWMPGTDGISLLHEWHKEGSLRSPVVILSGHGTVETAVEATRLGAADFVEKPLSLAKLLRTVEKALEKGLEKTAGKRPLLLSALGAAPIGRSPALRALRDQAPALARRREPLLIVGEAGVGRGALARYLHSLGDRSDQPCEVLAGAAALDGTFPAVLLGAEGSGGAEAGALERAGAGTLYISDVHRLGDASQQLLAGILEQRQWSRPGHATPLPLAARIIASVEPDARGRVAPALLGHLAVLEITVPPLRDRPEDVTELLRATIEHTADAEHLPFRRFGLAAQNRLRGYPWPGNVRELENLVRRLMVAGGAEEIGLEELEAALTPPASPTGGGQQPLIKQDLLALPLREAREQFERAYLMEQLALCHGRVGLLAKRVGMERTHLYRKLRSLGVDFRQHGDDE